MIWQSQAFYKWMQANSLVAALFQEEKPITFASKSLNMTEQNHTQIEKELCAILFSCKRFHWYLYGHEVTMQSDHKPSESITKKPPNVSPRRLRQMLLQLQKYDLHVLHVPGKNRKIIPAQPEDSNTVEDLNMQVHCLFNNMPVSDKKMQQL